MASGGTPDTLVVFEDVVHTPYGGGGGGDTGDSGLATADYYDTPALEDDEEGRSGGGSNNDDDDTRPARAPSAAMGPAPRRGAAAEPPSASPSERRLQAELRASAIDITDAVRLPGSAQNERRRMTLFLTLADVQKSGVECTVVLGTPDQLVDEVVRKQVNAETQRRLDRDSAVLIFLIGLACVGLVVGVFVVATVVA